MVPLVDFINYVDGLGWIDVLSNHFKNREKSAVVYV